MKIYLNNQDLLFCWPNRKSTKIQLKQEVDYVRLQCGFLNQILELGTTLKNKSLSIAENNLYVCYLKMY